jgi:hypothetical protein
MQGLSIYDSANHLRNYAAVEKFSLKMSAGWFLKIRPFEHKYKLAYHLYDSSEHVTWLRLRMAEMRAGSPDASIRPDLLRCLSEVVHAPDEESFLCGLYGVLKQLLHVTLEKDLTSLDQSANANEYRLLSRIERNVENQLAWYRGLGLDSNKNEWSTYLKALLKAAGGVHGTADNSSSLPHFNSDRFRRPRTILFDDRIQIGELMSYDDRLKQNSHEATIEQFKVFFNEFYAAALLASILYDALDSDSNEYPWEFFADFSRHFWDEARHSEFGAIRLKELGTEPDICNPILFELSENLPVLHRLTYLTRGLESYFMPRKSKRMREYEQTGDTRSQLFADQDWSDEINHVRYGTKWVDFLLEKDARDIDDILEDVKQHLSKAKGKPVTELDAPF